jgi:ABC-type Fe3+/spermidine/putrescine transport system ATPase subunit
MIQVDRATGMAQVDLGFEHPVTSPIRGFPVEVGQKVQMALRPENIYLEDPSSTTSVIRSTERVNTFEGFVKEAVFLGDFIDYKIDVKGKLFRVRAHPDLRFGQGIRVIVTFASKHACLLEQPRTTVAERPDTKT